MLNPMLTIIVICSCTPVTKIALHMEQIRNATMTKDTHVLGLK